MKSTNSGPVRKDVGPAPLRPHRSPPPCLTCGEPRVLVPGYYVGTVELACANCAGEPLPDDFDVADLEDTVPEPTRSATADLAPNHPRR